MDTNSPAEPRSSRFSLRDVFVAVAVVCFLLVGLAIPAVRIARDEARRSQCANSLMQIGLSLRNYHDAYQSLPPAFIADEEGRPMHSWRVMSLPYLTCDSFYDCYNQDEPWDSPRNLKLASKRWYSNSYHCCADPSPATVADYLAVVGDVTAWPGPLPSHLLDFAKGTSHSILLVEQANSGIEWPEPRDLQFDRLELTIHCRSRLGSSRPLPASGPAISSEHPMGAHAVFTDGSVEFLAADTSPEVLKDMLVIGGERAVSLGPTKRIRLVDDLEPVEEQVYKRSPYRPESYTLDETSDPNR